MVAAAQMTPAAADADGSPTGVGLGWWGIRVRFAKERDFCWSNLVSALKQGFAEFARKGGKMDAAARLKHVEL